MSQDNGNDDSHLPPAIKKLVDQAIADNPAQSDTLQPGPEVTANVDMTHSSTPLPPMMPPPAYEFPWRDVRDFIAMNISLMMAQQSLMVGEAMMEQGAPHVTEEKLSVVRAQVRALTAELEKCNARVERGIIDFEGKGPRLILPR